MPIRVQTQDFDLSTELAQLRAANPKIGAIVSFVGTVRDLNGFAVITGTNDGSERQVRVGLRLGW